MRKLNCSVRLLLILLIGIVISQSCKKGFLDRKPSSDLVVPTTLEDFQALLDNDAVMAETPALGELSTDDYYLLDTFWRVLNLKEHNAYIWAVDIYGGQGNVDDWNLPYQQIFYANIVLEGLPGVAIDSSNLGEWSALKGAAYFIRAYAFYNIAQVFCPAYNSVTANNDLGIPLRLTSDVNTVSTRSKVSVTYNQILSDLQQASSLLPWAIPVANLNRPSKPAALAMLARVCLSMGAYGQAGVYADSCLKAYSLLLDYNTISNTNSFPFNFSEPNPEILYESHTLHSSVVLQALLDTACIVDSNLYNSYASNDLRKSVYYKINKSGLPNIKGSYIGTIFPFSGLAVDEVLLIRAECSARASNTDTAMGDLNLLLQNRWVTGSFIPYTASNPEQAKDIILAERRKELAFRMLRWSDLRRLNNEGANISLARALIGLSATLPPKDPRYILPIPPDVINLGGIVQNPR